jgi:hypothetical protein
MQTHKFITFPITLLLLGFTLSVSAGDEDWPEFTEDGLQRVHDSKLAIVYVEPGADLSGYNRVKMTEATVAFKKNWERNQRSRSASKLSTSTRVNTSKIKKQLAQEFDTVFTETLNSGGFPVVDEVADDVLLVRPAIVDLDIAAPETRGSGRSNSYVRSAGEMTLYIELYDSVTGDLITKALDRRADRENQDMYTWANSTTNKMAADRILQGWADIMLGALKEAKTYVAEVEVVEEVVE